MGKIRDVIKSIRVKGFLPFYLFTFLPLSASAQGEWVVRGGCTPGLGDSTGITRGTTAGSRRLLPTPQRHWDAGRVYKQLVILVSYSDTDFSRDDPRSDYDKILNQRGYNEGVGPGCVADYFREQSGGLFNLECDVFGPYKLSSKAQPYEKPTVKTRNYGTSQMRDATKMMLAENPGHNYRQYDWNGDGYVDQVIYVFAGYAGNQGSKSYGYLWPNTASISSIATPDGVRISNYTASAEKWLNNKSCGIGTICHEFSHSLGLPDIYPTDSSVSFYSVCDEWDLMDGGNFTNWGWCPPNYTAQEKMCLGWLTPTELAEPATVKDMRPVSEGGEVYIVRHTDNEYLLLENHRWTGWDVALPGQGLLITHVDYSATAWNSNSVNISEERFRYDIVHADNLHYEQWDELVSKRKLSTWVDKVEALHNHHLSSSPFPWVTDSTEVNRELTDTSVPSPVMYNKNASGSKQLAKAITNISVSDDGLVSFDFMGGDHNGVESHLSPLAAPLYYDLQGRRTSPTLPGMFIIRCKDGTTKKVFTNP